MKAHASRWWPVATAGGALLALAAAGQDWAVAVAVDPVLGQTETPVTGTQVGATVTAGGLLAGAALLAGLTGGRGVRRIAALGALAGAALVAWPGGRLLLETEPAVLSALSRATGVHGGNSLVLSSVRVTAWPWLDLLAAALLVGGAAGAWRRSHRDGATPASGAEPDAGGDTRTPISDWDRLSEGEDPTDEQR